MRIPFKALRFDDRGTGALQVTLGASDSDGAVLLVEQVRIRQTSSFGTFQVWNDAGAADAEVQKVADAAFIAYAEDYHLEQLRAAIGRDLPLTQEQREAIWYVAEQASKAAGADPGTDPGFWATVAHALVRAVDHIDHLENLLAAFYRDGR